MNDDDRRQRVAGAERTFVVGLASAASEREQYFALRRAIFCDEQGLFEGHDRDAEDETAHPIVCMTEAPNGSPIVVGVVRIYEESPRLWYGGRLGVAAEHRAGGVVGRELVKKAVSTACAWGCSRFLATVQPQNERFFHRLHWDTVAVTTAHGAPHLLMEAQLQHYLADPYAPARWPLPPPLRAKSKASATVTLGLDR